MYSSQSPIFNVPEIATLRRVKPLPKRRRTNPSLLPAVPSSLSAAAAAAAAVVASTGSLIGDPELEAAANALLVPPPPVPSPPSSVLPAPPPSSSTITSSGGSGGLGLGVNLDPDSLGLHLPDPCEATAEELLAHADTLSARMALQSYYMPMLGSVHEFLAAAAASAGISAGEVFKDRMIDCNVGQYVDLESSVGSVDYMYGTPGGGVGGGYGLSGIAASAGGMGVAGMGMDINVGMSIGMGMGMSGRDEDDEHEDGDYVDHLQQPGNTKKRKVPANVSISPRGDLDGSEQTQDEGEERGIPMGRVESDDSELSSAERYTSSSHHYTSSVSMLHHGARRGKLTAATLAGLQHKEMLKTRKRQLAAVLGALSHGDTLALDQALSVSYPFDEIKSSEPPKIRLSKRRVIRLARLAKMNVERRKIGRGGERLKKSFPACEFTFVCPSATADRLIATKEEVAMLRNRFEAELARQAAKAEQLAATSKTGSSSPPLPLTSTLPVTSSTGTPRKSGKTKRSHRAKAGGGHASGVGDQQVTPDMAEQQQQSQGTPSKSRGKKKKRSALANASNPHHLRNYVPSRLPHSGQQTLNQNNPQNWISPLPLQFLSAEIPPRRRQKGQTPTVQPMATAHLTNPADEWICAFCEYDLFYGDEQMYRRAVRSRKKILRRRRRARERAAAAASGNGGVALRGAGSGNVNTGPLPAPVAQPGGEGGEDIYEHGPPPAGEGGGGGGSGTPAPKQKWKGEQASFG
ncbi:hypothetical protein AX17_007551 [Amanita inopinata Kibby_2008]|nr:hypothetical protein AX17_007551 [Amanita inopinata Kibby_2008]